MIYYVKGAVLVTIQADCLERIGNGSSDQHLKDGKVCEYLDEISDLIKKHQVDEDSKGHKKMLNLAEYIDKSTTLAAAVTNIKIGLMIDSADYMHSVARIETSRNLDAAESKELLKYLMGQYSDGFGEGLEQDSFEEKRITVHTTEYDEEEDDFYHEEQEEIAYYYFHLWNRNMMDLQYFDISEAADHNLDEK